MSQAAEAADQGEPYSMPHAVRIVRHDIDPCGSATDALWSDCKGGCGPERATCAARYDPHKVRTEGRCPGLRQFATLLRGGAPGRAACAAGRRASQGGDVQASPNIHLPCDSASKCSGGDRSGRALCGLLDGVPHEVRASGCLLVSSERVIKASPRLLRAVDGVVGEARNTGGGYN